MQGNNSCVEIVLDSLIIPNRREEYSKILRTGCTIVSLLVSRMPKHIRFTETTGAVTLSALSPTRD